MSVTGNVITIIALEIVAAAIGYIIAWFYARSVYTPIIKGLEADKADLNKHVAALKDEFSSLNEKVNKLNERIVKLDAEIAAKDKEIKELSAKKLNERIVKPDEVIAEKEKEIEELPAEAVSSGKYVISIAKNGEHYFNLKSINGQTILTSEMYSSKAACTNGIESVMNNSGDDNRYERKLSANTKPYFNLKAANGEIIGTSEMYESSAGMENGIASVKKNGNSTNIEEE
jgi:uncharacterized protein YegP (UPF0339 family)/uncharacterized membrane-anchored protein YhcB (DUF1043 family)